MRTYESLLSAPERKWSLTDEQKERLGEHLETEYATLINLLGDNFHSVVLRMAVQIERIAMILSVLRSPSISSEIIVPLRLRIVFGQSLFVRCSGR